MPAGFFTQTLCVLLRSAPPLDELASLLPQVLRRREGGQHWEVGGPSLLVGFRPEVGGHVSVDLVDRPWPDDMGDPVTAPVLFGAWTMGHFGACTSPFALERAIEQAWQQPAAGALAREHRAFVRLRLSYAFGAEVGDPIVPDDCDPVAELRALTALSSSLLVHPEALLYFNPAGEVLADAALLATGGLERWVNLRSFLLDETRQLLDIVGLAQLDLPDLEVAFRPEVTSAEAIAETLRDLAAELVEGGDQLREGDPIVGREGLRLRVGPRAEGRVLPPRLVVRLEPSQ